MKLRGVVIIVCLYLIVTTVQAIVDMGRAGNKLTDRENRLSDLKKQQEELFKQKAAVEKPSFLEKAARDQLGLSKPGEEVVVIPPELLIDPTKIASVDATPNWKKWVRLWFWL
jgi:cell division protein FtsB